ncbi:MAG: DUF305 domain-containing protein [Pseudomonadota bacterium]
MDRHKSLRLITAAAASALILGAACGPVSAEDVAIVQPGAPGQPAKTLSAIEAATIANNSYSEDDVLFMQDMIPHHQQAVEMAALVKDRTNNESLVAIAERIDASQADEIDFMQTWLAERGEAVPKGHHHHSTHMSHEMMGMATPQQMADLAAASGSAFDAQFLTLMITHHEGAVSMVEDLLGQRGSAYDPVLFEFVNDIVNDQTAEVERMTELLAGLSKDPRAGLKAGFRDAGQAISNLRLVASMPKPNGFFDPNNPSGLPPIIEPEPEEAEMAAEDAAMDHAGHEHHDHGGMDKAKAEATTPPETATAEADRVDEQSNEETEWGTRSPLLSFSNTDMAFSDNMMIVGNYHGFNIYELDTTAAPNLISSVVCPGGQGDVSISGDLLIMSVEQTRGRVDCGREGIRDDVSEERFRGLRIFDISDPRLPRQVGQVQTCRGSHTHSIVSESDGKLVVYNSGTASIRDEDELEGCIGAVAGDARTALFRIDVIEIPINNPAASRIVDSPAVFMDSESGQIAGLWQGGDHGEDTQRTNRTDHCHDITVFPEKKIAAGACSGNGVIFDISDPYKPKRIDAVLDQKFAYWHSATFNNDGTKVLFTDEWGGGSRPRCRASDPMDWGANAIYDIVDGKLEFRSYYKIPAPQSEQENCVAHNGSIVPVPGRDLFVQAWYQGGISVIDFTDSANPQEIAYFDRGPIHPEKLVLGGYWSVYWYEGKIYGTEIVRGLDVLELKPSAHISEHEIAATLVADQGQMFNPQQQFTVTWPEADPAVAMAYVDQLKRAGALTNDQETSLTKALESASGRLAADRRDRQLARSLSRLASDVSGTGLDEISASRVAALKKSIAAVAGRL